MNPIRRKRFAIRMSALALFVAAPTSVFAAPQGASVCSYTYTTDADFDLGLLFNVNHQSPNNDQLQLNIGTASLPFVNVACSNRGTLVRIDVNTGVILGEYFTAPNNMGRDPSRTTVDQQGNVWVSNRAEGGFLNGQARGSVTRVGLVIGGTRGDKDPITGAFTPNPNGEYLQGPFAYSTCTDRDGDGLIRTSRGLGNVLAWSNAGSADSAGGVSTADDECIINYTRITGANARTVAIDANNDVWTGGLGDQDHEKLDGVTGQPVAGTQFNLGAGGYGGLVDANGILWSARGGSGLLRYDPSTGTGVTLGNSCGDYGIGIDPATGNIWHTFLSGGLIAVRDPAGACLGTFSYGSANAQGCAVDANGSVWVAHALFGATTVGHLRTDGTFVGNVQLSFGGTNGNSPTGVAVDANGKVWVTCYNTHQAMRIDPTAGALGGGGFPIGAVDLIVDLGPSAFPYNYSDMTGFVNATTSPTGTWNVVQDSGVVGQDWGTVSWTSQEPAGTSITVEARAADSTVNLPSATFVPVGNGQSLCGTGLTGRYFEVRTTFTRSPSTQVSPVLFDLTVDCCSAATLDCPPDFVEIWNGGIPAGQADPSRTGTATFSTNCTSGGVLTYSDISIVTNTPQNPHAPEAIITRRWTLTDACGTNLSCDQIITFLSPAGLTGALTLDVNPGQCPNVVAVNAPGTTRITLVGTWANSLANNVDRTSLVLARVDGAGNTLRLNNLPLSYQDVTRPYYGPAGGCNTSGPEAYTDANISVPNWMLKRAFGLSSLPTGTAVQVRLTGNLNDGTPIDVIDFITVN